VARHVDAERAGKGTKKLPVAVCGFFSAFAGIATYPRIAPCPKSHGPKSESGRSGPHPLFVHPSSVFAQNRPMLNRFAAAILPAQTPAHEAGARHRRARTSRPTPALFLPMLAVLAASPTLKARPKVDVVAMKNGDRYTCEIVELSQGQLKIKTDNTTGTVVVDWAKVDRLDSPQFFAVELSDGRDLAGLIQKFPAGSGVREDFRITSDTVVMDVAAKDVVVIAKSGTRFTSRLAGGISAGFSYAKGNNQLQYNVNANLNSRARRHEFLSSLSSTFSGEPGGIGTDRNNVNLQYWLSLTRNWLFGSYNDFLSSQEQQLVLRATFGFGLARHLVRTNRTIFTAFSGLVYTNENYRQDGAERARRGNVEGLMGARFSMFRFDSTQITAGSRIFPSLTDTGRYRVDSDIGGKIDLGHSITWNLNVYSNYDSRPPEDVPNSDFGVTFGLGWTF
jgi:hypothetical protein